MNTEMIQALEQYSIADLTAALEAKQLAQSRATQARDQQVARDYDAQVKTANQIARFARQNQNPVQWAQCMADAGLPISAAKVFAEVLATIFNRLEAVEAAQQQPPHMQGVERRG